MQNATVERLSKLIRDTNPPNSESGKDKRMLRRKPTFHVHLSLEEGWFSLFLLATVVYSTIWSVQAAGWVAHLNILSLTTALGLLGGLIAAKQRRLPRLAVHSISIVLGILLAFWQTAIADYQGSTSALFKGMHQWVVIAWAGGVSTDDSIFLFFITALGFILAYTSVWLVYRTKSPWLMVVANAVVLLINLNNIDPGYIVFLVVFLIASLLLLLRLNLHESFKRWRKQGLRYPDDLGWDVMQAGALICIGILIFSWLLPSGYINDAAAQVWNADSNPWVQVQDAWNRLVSVSGGFNAANHGNFTDNLALGGNPNLNTDTVFTVKTNDGSQYLTSLSYDTYNGRGWTNGSTNSQPLNAGQANFVSATSLHRVTQTITVVNPPGEQHPYLLGASEMTQVDQNAQVVSSGANGTTIAWLSSGGRLVTGEKYTVTSYASAADTSALRSISLPKDAPTFPPNYQGSYPITYYNPLILSSYLQVPQNLDANILALAQQITANAPTMYDKVVALENYLRSNYQYDTNIQLPAGEEGVSWFLFRSNHRGFCNYFATTMTVMARLLGIPARVAAGYTNGTYDPVQHQWVVRGVDAHSWTQIYFAGYGWVNFEPSSSFSSFARPLPGQYTTGPDSGPTGNTPAPPKNPQTTKAVTASGDPDLTPNPVQSPTSVNQQLGVAFGGIILLLLAGLIFFGIWWRRLFRRYGTSAQIFGRISLLANWAGVSTRRSQTPSEYIHALAEAAPKEAPTLERFGDIYVRELWADPASEEHPRRSGEIKELPSLWKRLQPRLFLHMLRHPHFLRWLPSQIMRLLTRVWQARTRRHTEQDF